MPSDELGAHDRIATERNSHRRSVLGHQLLATAGLGDALRRRSARKLGAAAQAKAIAESAREDGTSELLVMTTNDDARSS